MCGKHSHRQETLLKVVGALSLPRSLHPTHKVIRYVNCSSRTKAEVRRRIAVGNVGIISNISIANDTVGE